MTSAAAALLGLLGRVGGSLDSLALSRALSCGFFALKEDMPPLKLERKRSVREPERDRPEGVVDLELLILLLLVVCDVCQGTDGESARRYGYRTRAKQSVCREQVETVALMLDDMATHIAYDTHAGVGCFQATSCRLRPKQRHHRHHHLHPLSA